MNIVDEVAARQVRDGIPDRELAQRLGISRSLWRFIRAKERGISLYFLQGVVATYPDLMIEAQAILLAAYHARNDVPGARQNARNGPQRGQGTEESGKDEDRGAGRQKGRRKAI